MMYLQAFIESQNKKDLHIDNAVLDDYRFMLPDYAGIYFVFVGKAEKNGNFFRIPQPRLVYIGEAKDINGRHNNENGEPNHEHYQDFLNECKAGEDVVYAFAKIDSGPYSRKLIESALIYHFQPCINIKSKYTYRHKDTIINISSSIEFPFIGKIEVKQF